MTVDVSVVIPVKNREKVIERAVKSVLNQNGGFNLEIIIVDDNSIDNTVLKIKSLSNKYKQIILIENNESVGGAAARNIGAKRSKGKYLAFLDSDDEWLINHLQNKVRLMKLNNAQGALGAFNSIYGKKIIYSHLLDLYDKDIATYIFENGGDARTSTFVFEKDAFMQVMFDDDLGKHQDWDLAMRFDNIFKIVFDTDVNVSLYVDGDNRMSHKNNYTASNYFLKKHRKNLSNQAVYNFKLNICYNALKTESASENFKSLLLELDELGAESNVVHKRKYKIIKNPILRTLLPMGIYFRSKFK